MMKRHGPSPLPVVNGHRPGCWPEGIITAADLAQAKADGVDFERTRVGQLMSRLPGVTLTWETPRTGEPHPPCLSVVVGRPDAASATERVA